MSTLKSFQSEIQEIHARELARQRGRARGPAATTTRNVQGLDETSITGEPPPSRAAGVEDEVDAVLVLHLPLLYMVHSLTRFRHYCLVTIMTGHASP
jgi:hypothetical protein